MAFRAIDDTAAGDDRPYSAHVARHVRDGLALAARERYYTAGFAHLPADGEAEWSGLWPAPWGPFRVWVPSADRVAAEDVVVVLDCEADSQAKAGQPMGWVCATSISADGRWSEPPRDREQWVEVEHAHDGHLEVPLLGPQLCGQGGWVGVLVWVWSVEGEVALSGTVDGVDHPQTVGITGVTAGHPHRTVRLTLGSDVLDFGVGAAVANGVQVWPLLPAYDITNHIYTVREIGYVQVRGIYLRVRSRSPRLPGPDAVASSVPVRGGVEVTLPAAAMELQQRRVPTYGGIVAAARPATIHWGAWRLSGTTGAYDGDAEPVAADVWRPVCSTLVPRLLPDAVGCCAVASWLLLELSDERPQAIAWRLAAYATPDGSLVASSDSVSVAPVTIADGIGAAGRGAFLRDHLAHWWLRGQMLRGIGSLVGQPDDWSQQVRLLQHVEVEWDWRGTAVESESSIVLKLEVQGSRAAPFTTGVVGRMHVADAQIASLAREITP